MRLAHALCFTITVLAACTEEDEPIGEAELGLAPTCVDFTDGVAGGVVDDTFIAALRPNRNFDGAELFIGPAIFSGTAMALLRPRLPASLASARVESAVLRLTNKRASPWQRDVNVYQVLAPWSERDVTWARFNGAYAAAPISSTRLWGAIGVIELDIRGLVQRWLDGTAPNHGVAIDTGFPLIIYAHEGEDPVAARRPTVRICFSTCADGAQNGDETGVDCGGARCGACIVDLDSDGWPSDLDCDDADDTIQPGAPELCNLRDDDCDGAVDDGACPLPEQCDGLDNDGDGVIDDGNPGGFVDCRHTFSWNPNDPTEVGGWWYGYTSCVGADVECLPVDELEACDGLDNNGDGLVDEQGVLCRDADGDGDGTPLDQVPGCAPVAGYVESCRDCDDTTTTIGPWAPVVDCWPEVYTQDNNCDGTFDINHRDCT